MRGSTQETEKSKGDDINPIERVQNLREIRKIYPISTHILTKLLPNIYTEIPKNQDTTH